MIKKEDLPTDWHFFVSSVGEWRSGNDVENLVKTLKRYGYPFDVYLVPLPENASYAIDYYAPQVPGSFRIAHYRPERTVFRGKERIIWHVETQRKS